MPGSLNGTYVNQERVETAFIRHGDELQIGKFRLVFFERERCLTRPDTHPVGPCSEGSHLSIGEVLALLLAEFPDWRISKIRFLESQGLIDPERMPSGYRKFFDPDVERLRMILREQRENYLPLRVIKDRIDSGELDPSAEPRRRNVDAETATPRTRSEPGSAMATRR